MHLTHAIGNLFWHQWAQLINVSPSVVAFVPISTPIAAPSTVFVADSLYPSICRYRFGWFL